MKKRRNINPSVSNKAYIPVPILVFKKDLPSNSKGIASPTANPKSCPPVNKNPLEVAYPIGKAT